MNASAGFPWVLELRTSQAPGTIKLFVEDRAVIGRADKALGIAPDLDLTPFNALENNIALEHVAIHVRDDRLYIIDLGSDKTTRLNGAELEPRVMTHLAHEARLQLGSLEFRVHIIASPTTGSVVHQQPNLQLPNDAGTGSGQLIMIVEDDPPTADLLRMVLQRAGFRTRICGEVVSAIRWLGKDTHSAIVLDLMLPNIHGLELCRYIRRDIHQRDIPIIVVSAASSAKSVKEAIEAGADVFLGKPFNVNEMVQKVAALVHWYEAQKPSGKTKQLDETETAHVLKNKVQRDAMVVFVSGYQDPLAVVLADRTIIGRRSEDASRPHIDLDRYGAFEAGVSRQHAAIHKRDGRYFIEDLGSSNGTWIKEQRLRPNELVPLENASELRLGRMYVRVFFFAEESSAQNIKTHNNQKA